VFNPYVSLILLGISYSLFVSTIWPALSIAIPEHLLGIGIGMATSFQNLGLVIFPIIVAFIYEKEGSYYQTLSFFIFMCATTIILILITLNEDKKNNNILENVHDTQVDTSNKLDLEINTMDSGERKSLSQAETSSESPPTYNSIK
jgi:MFS family permease